MVTDNTAYIGMQTSLCTRQYFNLGTSNWVGDYFIATAGIGMVIKSAESSQNSKIAQDLNEIFLRDWNSNYTTSANDYDNYGNFIK